MSRSLVFSVASGLLFVFSLTSSGCSKSDRPTTAKASGKVTLDGEPVAGASVVFRPVKGGRLASAITDNNGVYHMGSYDSPEDGVAVGEHMVGVIKISGDGASALAAAAPSDPTDPNANLVSPIAFVEQDSTNPATMPKIEYLVPKKYESPEMSGLKVTVPAEGSEQLNLELTK